MIPLPLTRKKNGCYYTQVHRTEKTALYSLSYDPPGPDTKIIGYEVFKIRIDPAGMLPNGAPVAEKEHFPSNEEFGKIAWSFSTQRTAMEKFQQLEQSLKK